MLLIGKERYYLKTNNNVWSFELFGLISVFKEKFQKAMKQNAPRIGTDIYVHGKRSPQARKLIH